MSETKPNQYLVIFALWLLVFSASSQIIVVAPMLPQIGAQLELSENLQGTLVSAYALTVGLFALVAGPISDHFGRRFVLLAGAGLMTVALGMHGVANSFYLLLTMRSLAGVAGGVLTGAAVSYVADYFPAERRGWANGWVMSSTALGQIASIPIGTLLAANFGFQTAFMFFGVVMAMAFLLVYKFLPQPDVKRSEAKLTVGNALAEYFDLLHQRNAVAAAAIYFLMFLSIALYVIYLPTWLTATFQATSNQIAIVFAVGGAANAITGPAAGRLSDQIGRKVVIVWACLGLAAIMVLTTIVVREFWVAFPLLFFVMIFVAGRMSPLQALISGMAPDERRGTLLSLTVSIGQLGFAAGSSIAGFAYTRLGYSSNTIAGATAAVLMAILVWKFLPETKRKKSNEIIQNPEQVLSTVGELDAKPQRTI